MLHPEAEYSSTGDSILISPPAVHPSRRSVRRGPCAVRQVTRTLGWGTFTVAVSLLFAVPLISALAYGAQYLIFANENIAYRYLYSARVLGGEGDSVWLPQGQLISLVQHIILFLMPLLLG